MSKVTNIFILFLSIIPTVILGRATSPLIEEDGPRARNRAAECVFGKEVKELGSQWVPDLGVPIGVLYCMKCECVPFHKKRRIVARVQCRNIKKECPIPSCDEPVLAPGRCCKVCPGDNYNPDIIQDIVPQSTIDEDEKSNKHFAALLTVRSSLILRNDDMQPIPNENKNNVVATGRFTIQKKNLYYSFYISDKAARPRALQFVDHDGSILEEHTLSSAGGHVSSSYQNVTRKVCGVWRRLSRNYRRLLKEEKMFVVLMWGTKDVTEFTLSGQIMKYVALGTELFSSLLEPAPNSDLTLMAGSGGTAIVSASTGLSPSIHIAVVFNGIFTANETSNVPVNITLSLDERRQIILEEKVKVSKPVHELNVIEVRSPVSPADLRLLTRGRLVLSVSSVSRPEALRLSGNVLTKTTCELFQTTLNSSGNDKNANPHGASGLAWVYLNSEGSLVYNVQIENLKENQLPAFITLNDASTKRKTELEDLTPYFNNGWANGTLDKLSPRVLEPLYSGNIVVNVTIPGFNSLIRGRLSPRFVADARDAPAPTLLRREDSELPVSTTGMVWLNVDGDCQIQYDVTLGGSTFSDRKMELVLETLPMIAPGAPVITRVLEEFRGNQVEGASTEPLPREELMRLGTGVAFVKIIDKTQQKELLKTTLPQIKLPSSCAPYFPENDIPTQVLDPSYIGHIEACFHEGKFYQEGDQWTTSDPCTMCFCQNGNPKCDTMSCPKVPCSGNQRTKEPGECCPVCLNSSYLSSELSGTKKCSFGGKFYSPGSYFHPFLIPSGFDLCTDCYCDPGTFEVKCTRQNNDKLCCKNCPVTKAFVDSENETYVNDPSSPNVIYSFLKPVTSTRSPQEILAAGGCKNFENPSQPYENGQKFHPWIASLGEYKCVTCKCKVSTK
ncbi:dorsal-ventral patterning protein Sog [Agrilus planipennis]|uniref:Dorsal-ventral patterning protein Sog n=1 Tax=Agrilus planipennis TaxID=224129 RepID=A0A1W4WSF8_AGRPL|nr:dorsal-ventral patterning protein Sog [Agrilus planipennis]